MCKWINSPDDFAYLINQHHPDIVKVNIEGVETHLLRRPNEVLTRVNEWLIEAHND
jgi:hypothetical protein